MRKTAVITAVLMSIICLLAKSNDNVGCNILKAFPSSVEEMEKMSGDEIAWESVDSLLGDRMQQFERDSLFRGTLLGKFQSETTEFLLLKILAKIPFEEPFTHAVSYYIVSVPNSNNIRAVQPFYFNRTYYPEDYNPYDLPNPKITFRLVGNRLYVYSLVNGESHLHIDRAYINRIVIKL